MDKQKQKWISDKIRLLENENKGRSHKQNIAIAYSMYNQRTMQEGGQQGVSQEEVVQMIMQMLEQQMPLEQIVQQLLQMGIQQEQAAMLIQQVAQQMMAQQEQQQPAMSEGGEIYPEYQYGGYTTPLPSAPNQMPNYASINSQFGSSNTGYTYPLPNAPSQLPSYMGTTPPMFQTSDNLSAMGVATPTNPSLPFQNPFSNLPQNFGSGNFKVTSQNPFEQKDPFATNYGNYSENLNNANPIQDVNINGFSYNPNAINPNNLNMGSTLPKYNQEPKAKRTVSLEDFINNTDFNKTFTPEGYASLAGRAIANKDTFGAITGGLGALMGIARPGLLAYSTEKANQRTYQDAKDNMRDDSKTYVPLGTRVGQQGGLFMQQGGTVGDMMTGNYITDTANPNTEIEDGEYVKHGDTGEVQEAVGEKHKNGGVKVDLAAQSKVLSDYTKVGNQFAKDFSDKFQVKVKANETFSDVMDKISKKIGLTDLIEDEKATMIKVEAQMKSGKQRQTVDLNLSFLSKKMQEIQAKKAPLEQAQAQIFDYIFQAQETIPKKGNGELLKQEGGEVTPQQFISDALSKGATEEELVQYLVSQGMEQQQAQEMVFQAKDTSFMKEGGMHCLPKYQPGGETPKVGDDFNFYQKSVYNLSPEEQQREDYKLQHFGADYKGTASGGFDPKVRVKYQATSHLPFLASESGLYKDNKEDLTKVGEFQKKWDKEYLPAVDSAAAINPFMTDAQKAVIAEDVKNQKLALSTKKTGQYDKIYGLETSSKGNHTLPFLREEEKAKYPNLKFLGEALKPDGTLKPEYSGLSQETAKLLVDTYKKAGKGSRDLGLGVIQYPKAGTPNNAQADGYSYPIKNNFNSYAGAVRQYNPFPTALVNPYLGTIAPRLTDPLFISPEKQLVNAANQANILRDSASSAPAPQSQAGRVQAAALSMDAGNEAIYKADVFNQGAQEKTDMYNLNARRAADIYNQAALSNYTDKVLKGKDYYENEVNRYFVQDNLSQIEAQNRAERARLLENVLANYRADNRGNITYIDTPDKLVNPKAVGQVSFSDRSNKK